MKKTIAFLIVMICIKQAVLSQSAIDSLNGRRIDTLSGNVADVQKSVDAMKNELIDSLKSDSTKKECNCKPVITEVKTCEVGKWLLIFSPFFLLILVVLIVAFRLKDFKFTEALTENEPPKKTIKNPEYNAAAIAANASIPNLSILFPTTIEISNIEPTLSELREIAAGKEAAVLAAQTSLENANKNTPVLNQAVTDAQAELDAANAAIEQLVQAVTVAQTQLDTANATPTDQGAITVAQKALEDAQKLVDDNKEKIKSATEKLKTAQNAVEENTKSIVTLTDLLPKTKVEAADAKKNVDVAELAAKNNTAFSVTAYRPSISRYIAFITSMVTIILVVCISSFFIYHYIRTGCPPQLGSLTAVVIALGLGVTPYITNKIATAATTNKP